MIKLSTVYMFMLLITGCSNNYGDTFFYKNGCGYDILVENSFYGPVQYKINDKTKGIIFRVFSQTDIGVNTAVGAKERLRKWYSNKIVTVLTNVQTNVHREISANELANAFSQSDLIWQGNMQDWLIDDISFCPDSSNKYNKEMNND